MIVDETEAVRTVVIAIASLCRTSRINNSRYLYGDRIVDVAKGHFQNRIIR